MSHVSTGPQIKVCCFWKQEKVLERHRSVPNNNKTQYGKTLVKQKLRDPLIHTLTLLLPH